MMNRMRVLPTAAATLALALTAATGLGGCAGVGTRAQVANIPHCSEIYFPVYFKGASAELTGAAQAVITTSGKHARGCKVAGVEVVGLADYLGPAEPALELSRRRAERVAAALIQAGLPAPSFKLSALGDPGSFTPDPTINPARRKVQVFIRFER
jgi:hypothetical protein